MKKLDKTEYSVSMRWYFMNSLRNKLKLKENKSKNNWIIKRIR